MTNPNKALGEYIHALRKMQGKTLQEVAAASGLTKGHLSQIEHGKGNPSLETISPLARALGVTVLFGNLRV